MNKNNAKAINKRVSSKISTSCSIISFPLVYHSCPFFHEFNLLFSLFSNNFPSRSFHSNDGILNVSIEGDDSFMTRFEQLNTYFQTNRNRHLDELRQFLAIESISALSEHQSDMTKAAEWLVESMKAVGLENVSIDPTDGYPVVYGDWMHAEGRPTILVYGHYDVQPVDPVE